MDNHYGVVIGRFQIDELHEGHLELFNAVYTQHRHRLIVLLGVHPDRANINNPLSFLFRKSVIEAKYPWATILPLMDMREDPKWSENVDRLIRGTIGMTPAIIYVGRDSRVPEAYSGHYPVKEIGEVSGKSASKRRTEISLSPEYHNDAFARGIIYNIYQASPVLSLAVDMAVLDPEGQNVLMVKKPEESKWRFPGGMIDPEEDFTFREAASRELHEETGIIAQYSDWQVVGDFRVEDWRSSIEGRHYHHTILFTTKLPWHEHPKAADDVSEVAWVYLDDPEWPAANVVEEHLPLWSALRRFWIV